MKMNAECLFVFACEFEDGGEWYHVEVDLVVAGNTFYRCRIQSLAESTLYVSGAGGLRHVSATEVSIDVTMGEEGQWVDLDFGTYPMVENLGQLIEQNTL